MSLNSKAKKHAKKGTDPARSLKPFISNETFYNGRCSCLDVFREELLGIDCRVDDVGRFRCHIKRQGTFPTVAHTLKTATRGNGSKASRLGGTGYNKHTFILGYKEGTNFEGRGRNEWPNFKNHRPLPHRRVHRTSPLQRAHYDHLYCSALLQLAKLEASFPFFAVPSSPFVFCKPRP